ncbi:MAG: methyltransferase domain-containing protein [Elusimicrobia bacterium]|nr:methyltransferase domain-containing protein [Elusimicrobiota bacterium]
MSENDLYGKSYFRNRLNNDEKRLISFQQEKLFIEKYCSINGKILDVGCSTGEFLASIGWKGKKYGIEISQYAATLAVKNGIEIVTSYTTKESLDVVIYRGTIQHLPKPFESLMHAKNTLKTGGWLFILATPNANSLYYKFWNTLPALSPDYNWLIPSDIMLKNIMRHLGFSCGGVQYPYFKSPYSKIVRDHLNFVLKLFGSKVAFPFWRSMMSLAFKKV